VIPFFQSVNGGPPEPITALSPIAWYQYGVGITSATDLVSAWADQSGNGNDLVQATDTNKPTLQSDNSILFDGSDNQMEVAFTLDQPCTFYLLMRQVTWTSTDVMWDGSAAQVQGSQSVTTPRIGATAGAVIVNTALAVNTYGVVAVVYNGASGVLQVNSTTTTGDIGANNPGGFSLGANRSVTAAANIQVKEVIIFPVAHDAATRTTVITYLATVGGVNI